MSKQLNCMLFTDVVKIDGKNDRRVIADVACVDEAIAISA